MNTMNIQEGNEQKEVQNNTKQYFFKILSYVLFKTAITIEEKHLVKHNVSLSLFWGSVCTYLGQQEIKPV